MPAFSFSQVTPFAAGTIETVDLLNRGWNNSMALKQGDQAFDQFVGVIQTSSVTGVQNNFALSDSCATLLWTGTLDTTFTGFTGGRLGRRVRIIHGGTSTKFLRVASLDAGSSAANQVGCASIVGQYIGQYGVIELEWTGAIWLGTVIHPGYPINVAYAAGSFGANGTGTPTWTLPLGASNLSTFSVVQVGQRLTISLNVTAFSVGGTTVTNLALLIPLGATARSQMNIGGVDLAINAGTFTPGIVVSTGSSTLLGIYRYDRTNFVISASNNYVSFDVGLAIL